MRTIIMVIDKETTISVIQLAINFSLYLYFILYAFQGKMRYRPFISRMLIGGYTIFSIGVIIVFMGTNPPFPQCIRIIMWIWVCITILMGAIVLRSNMLQLLFLIFIVINTEFNIMRISGIAYKLDCLPHLFASHNMHVLYVNTVVKLAFIGPIWYLFVVLFKKVISTDIDKSYWKYLFIIPITSYLYSMFSSMNYSLIEGRNLWIALLNLILLNIFSFLSYAAVLQVLIKTNESLTASREASIVQEQLLIQSEQYRKLADNMDQTRRLRHDIRHHLIALRGYVENNDLGGAGNYLDGFIKKELAEVDAKICDNHSIDMILRHYVAMAREIGTNVSTHVQLPNDFEIPDTDLCVVFGNLVENAVESCRKQQQGEKIISIKAKNINGSMLAISVTNSYDREILQKDDEFISDKHSGTGVGTHSVRSIAERNGGNCKYSFKDGIFKATVLLVP